MKRHPEQAVLVHGENLTAQIEIGGALLLIVDLHRPPERRDEDAVVVRQRRDMRRHEVRVLIDQRQAQ